LGSRRLPVALVAAALAAAIAWALIASAAPARVGTVDGAIVYSGGPPHVQGGDTPRGGRVTAYRGDHAEAHVSVRPGKRFRLRLRVGRYELKAVSGDAHCLTKPVRVHRAATARVRIVCSVR
jgi:hypothetical protein